MSLLQLTVTHRDRSTPSRRTAVELKRRLDAERAGEPFLVWTDAAGVEQVLVLAGRVRVTVGRRSVNDVVLAADGEASRIHAELERVGDDWVVVDGGLSRNGTFVNGQRLQQRYRLDDGDEIRFGRTTVEYHNPAQGTTDATSGATQASDRPAPDAAPLTDIQRRILAALCRPYQSGNAYVTPATNREIAAEVYLGVDAVKAHLRHLFHRFGVAGLPQNQKRAALAQRAVESGIVTRSEP